MPKHFVRTPFNYDRNAVSKTTGLHCKDPSLTQQQFIEECDINTIVERFHLTGEVPQLTELPSFGNFTGIFDFQSAQNAIRQANEQFMELPAKLRARFHNDPQEFLEFCSDADNRPEAVKLGLVAPPPDPTDTQLNLDAPNEPQTPSKTPKTPPKTKTPPKGEDTDT